uniref:rhomboid protease n=1 Tax=Alona affinis TaxID=381656 RepID=A0A9N6ZDK9_9CRUS|nr:EOG090X07NR [Alona affinis]
MLSVHRSVLFSSRSSLSATKLDHVRRIFLSGSRSSNRQARSPFQSSRRVKLTPSEVTVGTGSSPSQGGPRIFGPVVFAFGFSGTCFTFASIWEYEQMRTKALQFKSRAIGWAKNRQDYVNSKHGDLRNQLNAWWKSLTEEQMMFYGLLFINTLVFAAWKVPSWQKFMAAYFCSNPFARAVCWPMVFSNFSHYNFLHFGLNMYVLKSFMDVSAGAMGKEQFLAFYLSAGIMSSLGSHIFKTLMRSPGLSLGASGCIMGVLAYFCSMHPDALLQIAFVPGFTFTADSGLKALLCFDSLGLLMRWKMLDHAAHLGGALFGLFWYHWGQNGLWNHRTGLLEVWHSFRNGRKPGE